MRADAATLSVDSTGMTSRDYLLEAALSLVEAMDAGEDTRVERSYYSWCRERYDDERAGRRAAG